MNIKTKTLFFILITLSLLFPFNGFAQDKGTMYKDTLDKQQHLDEVIVKQNMIQNKGDHQRLLLSNENRKFGTNALDAVSSLPLFYQQLNATDLLSFDQKKVMILINGIPSTALDLRGLKAGEIKFVEYYNIPPAQYMALTSGPVANIITKKRHDIFVSVYANTSNSFTTGNGTNQVSTSYADSINQFKVDFFNDYRNVHHINGSSQYAFDNGAGINYFGDRQKFVSYKQMVQLSYQRYKGPHLLNIRLKQNLQPSHQYSPATLDLSPIGETFHGEDHDTLSSNSNSYSLDLFYKYSLPKEKSLSFNIVNTFIKSHSAKSFAEDFDGDFTGQYFHNKINNKVYSLKANANFTSKIGKGSLFTGFSYSGSFLTQTSENLKYKPETNNYFIYTGAYWQVNKFSIYPSVGLGWTTQKDNEKSIHYVIPYLRFYTDWWPERSLKGFTIQLTLNMQTADPSLGQLTASRTYVTPFFYTSGNPEAKHYWKVSSQFVIAYFKPNSRNNIIFKYTPTYTHKPFASVLSVNEKEAYIMPMQIGNTHYNEFYLTGHWAAFKWLMISPYLQYYNNRYDTPNQDVRLSYFRYGGSLTFTFDKMEISMAGNSPIKSTDGDLINRSGAQYYVGMLYKFPSWTIGLSYNYAGKDEFTRSRVKGFQYNQNSDWRPFHTVFCITATWSFSKGKMRHRDIQTPNSSFNDNGLTKFNEPKAVK